MYRLYHIHPNSNLLAMEPPTRFDPEGFVKYVKWVKDLLGDDCLGAGCGCADLLETQPIYGNDYKAIAYFDFPDRLTAFDAFDKHDYVMILDKMLEFTEVAPILQGVYVADI